MFGFLEEDADLKCWTCWAKFTVVIFLIHLHNGWWIVEILVCFFGTFVNLCFWVIHSHVYHSINLFKIQLVNFRNENYFILDLPSCYSKPVWPSLFCETIKKIFWWKEYLSMVTKTVWLQNIQNISFYILQRLFMYACVTQSQRREDPCAALLIQNASQTGRVQTQASNTT